jgi:hypothetical protein
MHHPLREGEKAKTRAMRSRRTRIAGYGVLRVCKPGWLIEKYAKYIWLTRFMADYLG